MYDLIIIGAGPGGIALAAEACASGINQSQILVLEKGATHNSAIRQLYPDQKLTTANYKGFEARCEGLLCVSDMTKSETIEFFDRSLQTTESTFDLTQRSSVCRDSIRMEKRAFEWNPQMELTKAGFSLLRSAYLAAVPTKNSVATIIIEVSQMGC